MAGQLDWASVGNDEQVLDMLSSYGVSGEESLDYAGATPKLKGVMPTMIRRPQARQPSALNEAGILRALSALAGKLKAVEKAKHAATLRQAAMAGEIPCIFLGIDSNATTGAAGVLAGAPVVIQPEPNTPLRIVDMIFGGLTAADFLLTDLQVGRLNLMVSGDPIPADAFQTGVQRPPIEAPRLPAGTRAQVAAVNIALVARRLVGMFVAIDLSEDYRNITG